MSRISTNVDSLVAFQKLSANTSRPGRPGSSRETESDTDSKGRTDEVSSKQAPEGPGPRAGFGRSAAGLEDGVFLRSPASNSDAASAEQEPEELGPRASFGRTAAGLDHGRSLLAVNPTATVNANRASELASEIRFELLGIESGGDASMAGADPANAIDLMLE